MPHLGNIISVTYSCLYHLIVDNRPPLLFYLKSTQFVYTALIYLYFLILLFLSIE